MVLLPLVHDNNVCSASGFSSSAPSSLLSDAFSNTTVSSCFKRLLVVANRLPLTVSQNADGEFQFTVSSGGLVSGLKGLKGFDSVWVGWPGNEVAAKHRGMVIKECQKSGCHPVFLDQATIDLFYNGFCNNVLWPLFHYIAPPMDFVSSENTREQWAAYCKANEAFVEAILEVYEEGDLVWVHDYHLVLVPKILRDRKPDARIGWFLHTPFPSHELYRMLPFRTEILTGLLSANFIAFHVYDYMRHFINSCVQLLGLENSSRGVDASPIGGVFVYCSTIPIGVEPTQFSLKLQDPFVIDAIRNLKSQFGDKKIILGVDRLDYMKGIPHKLNAFDRFLKLNPDWVDKCVMVQLAVPSRSVVPEYQRLKSKVHESVGKINGKRGKLGHVPVHYLDQSLTFDKLVALYRVADVALITSIRDGMNLVAYEYIASQEGKCGVLILSEFAGAAQSLGAGSIRINPWNIDESAAAIKQALSMSTVERQYRHEYAFRHVNTHTSQKWAETFVDSLIDATLESEEVLAVVPPLLMIPTVLDNFQRAKHRLLVIDVFDCLITVRGNAGVLKKRFQNLMQLPESLKGALTALGTDPNTVVIITSDCSRAVLEQIFGGLPVCLAAEKGCVYRNRQGKWLQLIDESALSNLPWLSDVQEIYNSFQERTPGSYVECNPGTITWHWDDTQLEFGRQQSRDLLAHLLAGPLDNAEAEVVMGLRSLETRSPLCSRDKLMVKVLEAEFGAEYDELDFVLCVGNFPWRDEDVYAVYENFVPASGNAATTELLSRGSQQVVSAALEGMDKGGKESKRSYYLVSVGTRRSKAKYYLPNAYHVQSVIRTLADNLPLPTRLYMPPAVSNQVALPLLQPPRYGYNTPVSSLWRTAGNENRFSFGSYERRHYPIVGSVQTKGNYERLEQKPGIGLRSRDGNLLDEGFFSPDRVRSGLLGSPSIVPCVRNEPNRSDIPIKGMGSFSDTSALTTIGKTYRVTPMVSDSSATLPAAGISCAYSYPWKAPMFPFVSVTSAAPTSMSSADAFFPLERNPAAGFPGFTSDSALLSDQSGIPSFGKPSVFPFASNQSGMPEFASLRGERTLSKEDTMIHSHLLANHGANLAESAVTLPNVLLELPQHTYLTGSQSLPSSQSTTFISKASADAALHRLTPTSRSAPIGEEGSTSKLNFGSSLETPQVQQDAEHFSFAGSISGNLNIPYTSARH